MNGPFPKDENGETWPEKMWRLSNEGKIRKKMLLFNRIEGGVAIIRKAPGILKQVEIFSRGEQVFIKEGSGFIRISDKLGKSEPYLTIHPNYQVLELEGAGVILKDNKAPSFTLGWK